MRIVGAAIERPITFSMNGTCARPSSCVAIVWKPLWPPPPASFG
jgi:hypothetical protein